MVFHQLLEQEIKKLCLYNVSLLEIGDGAMAISTPIDFAYLHGIRDNSMVPFGQGWGMVYCKSKIME